MFAHYNSKKRWWQFTLEEQLNCVYNGLAKVTVSRSQLDQAPDNISYLLPLDKLAVVVNGEKSTTDVAKEMRVCLGEEEVRKFYTNGEERK